MKYYIGEGFGNIQNIPIEILVFCAKIWNLPLILDVTWKLIWNIQYVQAIVWRKKKHFTLGSHA